MKDEVITGLSTGHQFFHRTFLETKPRSDEPPASDANTGAHDVLSSGGRMRAGIIIQQNYDVFPLVVINLCGGMFGVARVLFV